MDDGVVAHEESLRVSSHVRNSTEIGGCNLIGAAVYLRRAVDKITTGMRSGEAPVDATKQKLPGVLERDPNRRQESVTSAIQRIEKAIRRHCLYNE
jgi:hypothetical protein